MGKVGRVFRETLADGIKQNIGSRQNTFVISYSGISASRINDLRKDMHKVGARVCASRNRIAQLALRELEFGSLSEAIERQTSFVWSDEDSVTVAKALIAFSEKCEQLAVRGGIINGAVLPAEQIKRLSELPSKDILLAQLLQMMLSPMTRLAGALNAKTRDLLSILKQLSEKKKGETKMSENVNTAEEAQEKESVELSPKLEEIAKQIESLTALELSDLVKGLEDRLGIQAAAPMPAGMMMAGLPAAGGAAAPEEEKTEFDVILKEIGSNKISVIKEVRAATNLGLKEAKDLVEAAPKAVKEAATKEEAEELKKKLEAAGAKVELK